MISNLENKLSMLRSATFIHVSTPIALHSGPLEYFLYCFSRGDFSWEGGGTLSQISYKPSQDLEKLLCKG